MTIRKAIIPCGGLGTRFLPVTKAVPKEILPIIDTPVLAYIVDELAASGMNDILIILGEGKAPIREYFSPSAKWDSAVKFKPELAAILDNIAKNVNIEYATQKRPRGSGDAVMCAREFTGGEAFCMCNGDDLMVSDAPVCGQLAAAYEKENATIVGVQKVAPSETNKYGIIKPVSVSGRTVYCEDIVEKPKSDPPSLYAAMGRYILTPEIYDEIAALEKSGKKGEVGLTDAICALMKRGKAYAYEFDGKRYDMGDKFGALTATVDFALKRPELRDKFKQYLKDTIANED